MKTLRLLLPALALSAALSAPVLAHDLKVDDFQVTGTVSEMNDTSITVMKGKERFQIARDKDTKMTGDAKVGGKVTVHYKMYAISVESKDAAAKKTDSKKKK
jgi:uncharacterized cupredoxin-like copper-binding protein